MATAVIAAHSLQEPIKKFGEIDVGNRLVAFLAVVLVRAPGGNAYGAELAKASGEAVKEGVAAFARFGEAKGPAKAALSKHTFTGLLHTLPSAAVAVAALLQSLRKAAAGGVADAEDPDALELVEGKEELEKEEEDLEEEEEGGGEDAGQRGEEDEEVEGEEDGDESEHGEEEMGDKEDEGGAGAAAPGVAGAAAGLQAESAGLQAESAPVLSSRSSGALRLAAGRQLSFRSPHQLDEERKSHARTAEVGKAAQDVVAALWRYANTSDSLHVLRAIGLQLT